MKSRSLVGLGVLISFSVWSQEIEILCSKALLSEMQKQKLISNSSGICLQSLTDLPQVNIGLGSSVYSSGAASGKSLGNDDVKIKEISEILTGTTLGKTPFEVHGYADGQNNTLPSYTDQFLGTKATFTKADIRSRIKDAHTSEKILELLSDVDDSEELNPVRGGGSKSSFKKESGVKYHQNIERVMSLVNNYYLAIDRSVQTCMQLMEGTFSSEEIAKKNCSKKVAGYASPNVEIASHGQSTCDARRKAVLILNPGVKATSSEDPGSVHPNFKIPQEGESRRDMQMAATLDLFKKISKSGGEPATEIDKIALKCSGDPLDSTAYNFNRDNLLRMYSDIQSLSNGVADSKLKEAVLKGDYPTVKKYVEEANEQLGQGLVTKEDPVQKLMDGLNFGLDSSAENARVTFSMIDPNSKTKIECSKFNDGRLPQDYEINYTKVPVFRCARRVDGRGTYSFYVMDPNSKTKVFEIETNNGTDWDKRKYEVKDVVFGNRKYPNASRDMASTDVFNCLSSSAAIEEKLSHQNQTGAGGELIDPYDLRPDKSGKVKVSLDTKSIPSFTRKGPPDVVEKGWMCERCHNGLIVTGDAKSGFHTEKRSREVVQNEAGKHSQSKAPVTGMGLTFGSMKNLGFRKVTRESFDGKCAPPKKVCDCLKNASSYGGLDNIIAKSTTVNLNANLQADMDMAEGDMKNSCLYTPPLAHSCSVAPSGQGADAINRGLKSPTCQALDRFLAHYPERGAVINQNYPKKIDYLNTFQQAKLAPMLCKNAFPSEDDAKDCKTGTAGGSSGSGSKASHQ